MIVSVVFALLSMSLFLTSTFTSAAALATTVRLRTRSVVLADWILIIAYLQVLAAYIFIAV